MALSLLTAWSHKHSSFRTEITPVVIITETWPNAGNLQYFPSLLSWMVPVFCLPHQNIQGNLSWDDSSCCCLLLPVTLPSGPHFLFSICKRSKESYDTTLAFGELKCKHLIVILKPTAAAWANTLRVRGIRLHTAEGHTSVTDKLAERLPMSGVCFSATQMSRLPPDMSWGFTDTGTHKPLWPLWTLHCDD